MDEIHQNGMHVALRPLKMNVIAQREARGTARGDTMMRSISHPELHGGEAIDIVDVPTEFDTSIGTERDRTHYNYHMLRYYRDYTDQACSWYHTVDVASFVREEDEEAVRADQERMTGTAPTTAIPAAKAPTGIAPVYHAGLVVGGPRVPDAEVEPAYHWIKQYGSNRREASEN